MNGIRTNGSRITPLAVASGAIASFDAQVAAPLKILKADINPVQAGSGDPAPDNIRSISGWDSIKVSAVKQLFNGTLEQGSFNTGTGEKIPSTTRVCSVDDILLPQGSYVLYNLNGWQFVLYVYDLEGNFKSAESKISWNDNPLSFTLADNRKINFAIKNNTGTTIVPSDVVGLTLFDSAAEHPATIALPNTVYSGKLDVLSGSGIEDMGKIVFDGNESENWINYPARNGFYINIPTMKSGMSKNGLSNWLKTVYTFVDFGIKFGQSNTTIYCIQITNNIPEVTDLATWRTYLASHNLEIIFPLATPSELITDPISIDTFAGSNSIKADSGNTTACYLKGVTT